jgi:hypothetical protein
MRAWMVLLAALVLVGTRTLSHAEEPVPPCTGNQCANVRLEMLGECLWARNADRYVKIALGLTLSDGSTATMVLKSGDDYTTAQAPVDRTRCQSLENTLQTINDQGAAVDASGRPSSVALETVAEIKTCHAEIDAQIAAQDRSEEYYELLWTRKLGGPRRNLVFYISPHAVSWTRLKTAQGCVPDIGVIKSYTAVNTMAQ